MQYSLGKIVCVTPGTPVRLTCHEANPEAQFYAHAYIIRWAEANRGPAYISLSPTDDRASMSKIIQLINARTPSFNAGVVIETDGLALHRVYLDFDYVGDYVIASALVT